MVAEIRLTHPPAASSNPSPHPLVVLSIDAKKYVFNAPEGAVRTLTQRKLSLAGKSDIDVFLTDVCDATRGLPGLLLTLADSGKDKVRVYGPPSLAHAISTMRFYAKSTQCQLQVSECFDPTVTAPSGPRVDQPLLAEKGGLTVRGLLSWEQGWNIDTPTWTNQDLSNTAEGSRKRRRSSDAVPRYLAPSRAKGEADVAAAATASLPTSSLPAASAAISTQKLVFATAHDMFKKSDRADESVPMLDDPSATPRGKPLGPAWNSDRLPFPVIPAYKGGETGGPPTHPLALSYVATLPTLPGLVDMAKAQSLGVRPGPDVGRLQRGESITIRRPARWGQMSDVEKIQWSRPKPSGGREKGRKKTKVQVGSEARGVQEEPMEDVVVESTDIVSSPRPGPVVVLVHLPTKGHLPSFLSSENASTLETATQERSITAVIHTSPLHIVRERRYQEWIQACCTPETMHIFTDRAVAKDSILYGSPALSLLQLSTLNPRIFSVPPYGKKAQTPVPSLNAPSSANLTALELDETLRLQPTLSAFTPSVLGTGKLPSVSSDFDPNAMTGPDTARKQELTSASAPASSSVGISGVSAPDKLTNRVQLVNLRKAAYREFEAAAIDVKERVAAIEARESSTRRLTRPEWEGIEVTTLGTGSSNPSKYRGLSATLVQLPSHFFRRPERLVPSPGGGPTYGYILLDAGEGTLGQLHQRYGKDSPRLNNILQNLRLLFVSHIHADHSSGVVAVLRARYETKGNKAPLFLIGNPFTRKFLYEWDALQPLNLHREDEYATLNSQRVSDSVVMLEPEFLDYRLGAGAVQAADSKGKDEEGEDAYKSHLAFSLFPGFIQWLKTIRSQVIARPNFQTLSSRSGDGKGSADEAKVNQATWASAMEQDSHLHKRSKTMPAFVERALAEHEDVARLIEAKDKEVHAFFLSSAQRIYERNKKEEHKRTQRALQLLHSDLGSHWNVSTCEVDHRAKHCYGLVLRIGENNGNGQSIEASTNSLHLIPSSIGAKSASTSMASFSFAYSGDTRPTSNLSKAAKGVNLLIHEATMQDDEALMAHAKGHSTVGGALQIAKEAQCDVVLLTHFSQRYPKMAKLNLGIRKSISSGEKEGEGTDKDEGKRPIVTIGMDLLQVQMNEMWKLEKYLPVMEILFQADAHLAEVDEEQAGEGDEAAQTIRHNQQEQHIASTAGDVVSEKIGNDEGKGESQDGTK